MFRSLMAIIRELYLYLTKVIFMLKHSVKLRRYINLVMWQQVRRHHQIDKLEIQYISCSSIFVTYTYDT